MKNNSVKKLVEISLLIALEVILTRFCSINTATLRIGFGFLPIAIIAMMYGPLSAGVAYALGDLLGMMIFPNGSYFPGCIVCLGMNLCLDTAWLHILMGQGYLALLPQRIFKAVVMIPVQTVLIGLVWKNIVLKVDKSYGVMPNA